ncbi:Methyladenine glycosylase [Sesbania bispinosa]|nr:Methyladenine glycosylase [Sesbania bispinosa]
MPVVTKLQSYAKPVSEPRAILKPAGNRVAVSEEPKRKKENPQRARKEVQEICDSIVRSNVSVDSTCSTDSSNSSSNSSAKKVNSVTVNASRRTVKRNGFKPARVVPDAVDVATLSPPPKGSAPPKRCDWITQNSDPLYAAFHDEEWGIQVDDDRKLFELLIYSQALAEHSWPAILNHRDIFRKLFENFDPSSIAQFTEKKLLTLRINGNLLLSEPKLRAIVENAKQLLKVQQEFGSFSNYCWRFVNHKPIRNEFRYGRQVPVKTPKAELISKDMMRRGFQCVGPTVVYSFMQVAGLVNDHLITCFRYQECNLTTKNEFKTEVKEKKGTT